MNDNRYSLINNYPYLYQLANSMGYYDNYHRPINFRSGLSDVRNRLLEDIPYYTNALKMFFQQPMSNINTTEIGDRLGNYNIYPSTSIASSL